ncbi:MAG: ElyC/SanA/YdcF family protein, partial [Nitrospirales bacterium]
FLMKKIVGQILSPLPLCLAMVAVGLLLLWFTRKKMAGKIFVTGGFLLLAMLSVETISGRILQTLESQYAPLKLSHIQTQSMTSGQLKISQIVVLAGGIAGDPTLPLHLQILHSSRERLLEGIRLYRLLPGSQLILTGGLGTPLDVEATVLSRVAQTYGVKRADLVLEVQSRDTKDHPHYVSALLNTEPFILVTSAYHMPRAMKLFAKHQLFPIPAPIGHWKGNRTLSLKQVFPSHSGLRLSELAAHEYLGMAWAWLQGQI